MAGRRCNSVSAPAATSVSLATTRRRATVAVKWRPNRKQTLRYLTQYRCRPGLGIVGSGEVSGDGFVPQARGDACDRRRLEDHAATRATGLGPAWLDAARHGVVVRPRVTVSRLPGRAGGTVASARRRRRAGAPVSHSVAMSTGASASLAPAIARTTASRPKAAGLQCSGTSTEAQWRNVFVRRTTMVATAVGPVDRCGSPGYSVRERTNNRLG